MYWSEFNLRSANSMYLKNHETGQVEQLVLEIITLLPLLTMYQFY
jgi:hypothetical protein